MFGTNLGNWGSESGYLGEICMYKREFLLRKSDHLSWLGLLKKIPCHSYESKSKQLKWKISSLQPINAKSRMSCMGTVCGALRIWKYTFDRSLCRRWVRFFNSKKLWLNILSKSKKNCLHRFMGGKQIIIKQIITRFHEEKCGALLGIKCSIGKVNRGGMLHLKICWA